MSTRATIPIYGAFQLAAAGALIAWCVVFSTRAANSINAARI